MKIQFSIRDLLLIVAIVALAAGWWIDHQRINNLAVQQWVYRTMSFTGLASDLTDEGKQGWELCGVIPGTNTSQVILKRPARCW